MNSDQAEEAIKGNADKTQQKASKANRGSGRQAKHWAKQDEARMQKASDDMKTALRSSRHS